MLSCYNSPGNICPAEEIAMKKQPQITEQTKACLRDAF